MTYFLVTFVVMLIVIAIMAIGVIFGRRAIKGSCGGGMSKAECVCVEKCDKRKKMEAEAHLTQGWFVIQQTDYNNKNKEEFIMLAKITVEDYMAKRLVTLTKDTNVIDAIKKLLDHKITCAPVVDLKGQLIGMFSEKDGMKVFLESVYNQGMSGKVGEYMTTGTISVDANSSIVDVAEKFEKSSVRSFPVFEDGGFVGVISRVDVLRALVAI
jgi:CBS domain-containing protein